MCVKKKNVMTSVLLAVPLLFSAGFGGSMANAETVSKTDSEKAILLVLKPLPPQTALRNKLSFKMVEN